MNVRYLSCFAFAAAIMGAGGSSAAHRPERFGCEAQYEFRGKADDLKQITWEFLGESTSAIKAKVPHLPHLITASLLAKEGRLTVTGRGAVSSVSRSYASKGLSAPNGLRVALLLSDADFAAVRKAFSAERPEGKYWLEGVSVVCGDWIPDGD